MMWVLHRKKKDAVMNKNLQKTTDPCKYPDNSFKLEVVGAFDRNILEREEKKSKAPLFESCFP